MYALANYQLARRWFLVGRFDHADLPDDAASRNFYYLFKCRCGGRYKASGDSFLIVREGGKDVPYMKRSAWGSWVKS